MARESKYDADKLRNLIKQGAEAQQICDELGIGKQTLKNYHHKLMLEDKAFYEIQGMTTRSVTPKVTKLGLRISPAKMESLGFSIGDKLTIRKIEDGRFELVKA